MHSIEAGHILGIARISDRSFKLVWLGLSVLTSLDLLFSAAYPPGFPPSVVPPFLGWVRAIPFVWVDVVDTGIVAIMLYGFVNLPRILAARKRATRVGHRLFGRHPEARIPDWLFEPV